MSVFEIFIQSILTIKKFSCVIFFIIQTEKIFHFSPTFMFFYLANGFLKMSAFMKYDIILFLFVSYQHPVNHGHDLPIQKTETN